MTTKQKQQSEFVDITDDVSKALRDDPALAAFVETESERMRQADREYAMGLAALRRAFDLTQQELADRLGTSQANIAKTEHRRDLLISTLNSYVHAIGGEMKIVVAFQGREVEVGLDALSSNS